MIYRIYMLFQAIFMNGLIRVTLKSGRVVIFKRPKYVSRANMANEFQAFLTVADNKPLKYTQWNRKPVVVRREDIASVEVW